MVVATVIAVVVVMETATEIAEDAVVIVMTATVAMTSLNATTAVRTTKPHQRTSSEKKTGFVIRNKGRDKPDLTDHKEWSVFEIYLENNRNSS